jgi:sulfur carrier protein
MNLTDTSFVSPAVDAITVVVNGTPEPTTARTLQAWVDARGVPPAALATAVNGQFVPRGLRAQQPLAEGDTILTFQPIEGG